MHAFSLLFPNSLAPILPYFNPYCLSSKLFEVTKQALIKRKYIYSKGTPIDCMLDPEGNVFDASQIIDYMPMFKKLNGGKDLSELDEPLRRKESRNIFHKINIDLQKKQLANQYVKLNIIHNMCNVLSTSIFIVFLLSATFEIDLLISQNYFLMIDSILYTILLLGLSILLQYRSKKYFVYWVRNMVRAYYGMYISGQQ